MKKTYTNLYRKPIASIPWHKKSSLLLKIMETVIFDSLYRFKIKFGKFNCLYLVNIFDRTWNSIALYLYILFRFKFKIFANNAVPKKKQKKKNFTLLRWCTKKNAFKTSKDDRYFTNFVVGLCFLAAWFFIAQTVNLFSSHIRLNFYPNAT